MYYILPSSNAYTVYTVFYQLDIYFISKILYFVLHIYLWCPVLYASCVYSSSAEVQMD